MIFQPQLYLGEQAFPWDGRISPKQLIHFPWLLDVPVSTNGKPVLQEGAPGFLTAVQSHQIAVAALDQGATTVSISESGTQRGRTNVVQGAVTTVSADGRVTSLTLEQAQTRIPLRGGTASSTEIAEEGLTGVGLSGRVTAVTVQKD